MISRSGKQRLKSNPKLREKYEYMMKVETNPDRKKEMLENLGRIHSELHEEERRRNRERLVVEGGDQFPGSGQKPGFN